MGQQTADRHLTAVVAVTLALIGSATATWPSNDQEEAELIRVTERERVRALVRADIETARRLHADEFQLINPLGEAYSKEQYLGGIASGQFDYVVWKPDVIDVRLYVNAAVIRYQSELEIVVNGKGVPRRRHWHTDCYEKRDGRWQIVWSQATAVK